tara:strand:- start:1 stop:621 length:621 start_codon:yes stop_codon:yes gene_type:complete
MGLVKYNNQSISSISDVSGSDGSIILIKTLTASSSATLSFVDGTDDVVLDNTYPIYLFKFINMHPQTDNVHFEFNMSVDTGSNYNVTKTTTHFDALHNESGSAAGLTYLTARDLAQGTGFKTLVEEVGGSGDESCSGELYLFNPSSTTFVKHFISRINNYRRSDYSADHYTAGYGNTTSAVDAVQFKMSSGNIDAGTIKLYGLKDS